jgi:2,3-diketo-5-methylthio-1-phosphopentane phosphatase
MRLAVCCDFDGTVMETDTSESVLLKFAKGDWRIFDEQLDKGEITLDECMRRQFSMVTATEPEILRELEKSSSFRPNFGQLVEYCAEQRHPFVIVSAGLDFVINYFVRSGGWSELVKVLAPKAKCTPNGIQFAFPKPLDQRSKGFKDDLVKRYKSKGYRVAYVGDSSLDLPAARIADYPFAIIESTLARLCLTEELPHKRITDFRQVLDSLKDIDSA